MPKSLPVKRKAAGAEGNIRVTRTVFGQLDEEQKFLEIRPFATEPARVGVKLGRTINLGNYESARIDVSVELPCYVEEAKTVYRGVLDMAANCLSEEVAKITKSLSVEQSVEELL